MPSRIWKVLILACLINGIYGQASSPQCSDTLARDLANKLDEKQEDVMKSLLETFSGLGPKNGATLDTAYRAFSNKFSKNATKAGYNHFVESLSMIAANYHKATMQPDDQSQDILKLVQHFNAAYGTKNSIELCDVFGKLLNYKDHRNDSQHRERRDLTQYECPKECDCPAGGIGSTEVLCLCHFFACLDEGRKLMPVFEGFEGLECLAFVLDTTGSMKDEIDATVQVIKDFIAAHAELGCYMLVPFNDRGSSSASVGPVTLTFVDDMDPNSIKSLQTLHNNLENAFQKKSGGDCPEYCYDGILEALDAQDSEFGLPVMTYGSQLVVITDAPSKGVIRASDIITRAHDAQVCIHFFLGANSYNCFGDDPGAIEEYETIANQTDGTVIKNKFDFSVFVHQYRTSPCGFLQSFDSRKKRSSDQVCHTVNVASLVCWLSLSIKTQDDVINLTKPDGTQVRIRPSRFRDTSERVALYSESHPAAGELTVCTSTPIEVSTSFQFCIDITPFYVMNTEDGPVLTPAPAPACTLGHLMLVSKKSAEVSSPRLYMLDRGGSVALDASLETCDSFMSTNVTMPAPGNYYYKLGGQDTAGNSIDHLIPRKITVPSGDAFYNLTRVGPESITVFPGQVAITRFRLASTNPYGPMTFRFSLAEQDLQHQISPSQYTLASGQSVTVTVYIRPSSSHEVALVAFNECSTLTASTSTNVRIVQPVVTTPPPSECNPPCLNGGTCTTIRRRRRVFHVCRCASNYYGRSCENVRN